MIRLFTPKVVNKVHVNVADVAKAQELEQAKGVMNNYLRDKNFTVTFVDSFDKEFVHAQGLDNRKTCCKYVAIKKESDTPFLRTIYKAIERLAKDPEINRK